VLMTSTEVGQGVLGFAKKVAGPAVFVLVAVDLFLEAVPDLLNCTGPVALGNATYAPNVLQGLQAGRPLCHTESYSYEVEPNCGFTDSSYSVSYCLELVERTAASDATGDSGRVGFDLVMYLGKVAAALVFMC
jgi:hypothetical protein